MFTLTVEKGAPAGMRFALAEGENIIGRSHSARVRLAANDISGQHARLTITGAKATVENLSRFGTKLDGAAVNDVVPLISGQRLTLGAETTLLFKQELEDATVVTPAAADVRAAPGDMTMATMGKTIVTKSQTPAAGGPKPAAFELKTGEAPLQRPGVERAAPAETPTLQPATGAAAKTGLGKTGAMAGGPAGEFSRTAWSEAGGAEEGATRAMQTRVAGMEEIEFLRTLERQWLRKRIILGICVGVPLLALLIFLWPRKLPPETEIEWPKDANGDYIDAFVPAPSGGFKDGGFDIAFPGLPGWKSTAIPGGIRIETRIGRDRDVPLVFVLQEDADNRYVEMERKAVLEEWMKQIAGEGGERWNFDLPGQLYFIGNENGLPCLPVSYQRDGKGSWFGWAHLFRHGRRRIVLRIEVPVTDRLRANNIITKTFINVSPTMERTFWEGGAEMPKRDVTDILRQVRPELDRMAPATWSELESILVGAIRKAAKEGNAEKEKEALDLLVRLRDQAALWFNSQRLAKLDADARGNAKRAAQIADFCKAVFSGMDDRRYFTVRKKNW